MSEIEPSAQRSNEELTDMTLEDIVARTPSEESAIQIAETLSAGDIRNQMAVLSAEAEIKRQQIKDAQGQLEATIFALNVYQQALLLAQDSNPGV